MRARHRYTGITQAHNSARKPSFAQTYLRPTNIKQERNGSLSGTSSRRRRYLD